MRLETGIRSFSGSYRRCGWANFFHGVNPSVPMHLLRTEPTLMTRIARVYGSRPWIRTLGERC